MQSESTKIFYTGPLEALSPDIINEEPLNAINVSGTRDVNTVVRGGTLQMNASVSPRSATGYEIEWSVSNGTGSAIISEIGLLTGIETGTVIVKATDKNSGIYGTLEVNVEAGKTEPLRTIVVSVMMLI